jgi:hypothetical protein
MRRVGRSNPPEPHSRPSGSNLSAPPWRHEQLSSGRYVVTRSAASEPSAERFRRARSGSPVLPSASRDRPGTSILRKLRFAGDSPLEEAGFEPTVPREKGYILRPSFAIMTASFS